jgi:hypothetical protein
VDVIDFDAWYEENVDPTIPFKLMGKDWEIPGDIPAIAMLRLERIERLIATADDDTELPGDLSLDDVSYEGLTRMMLGDELVDQWLAAGIGARKLQGVTRQLFAIYRSRQRGEAEGKEETDQEEAELSPPKS